MTFGGSSYNALQAQGSGGTQDSGDPATLTIASGITVQGGSGTICGYYPANDSLINQGTVTGSAGGTLTIGGANWSNTGTINGAGGTVNLVGSFTNAPFMTFTNSGGTVNLEGTLTNTTLTLSPALGTWFLSGGMIVGGTISNTGNSVLTLTSSGGTLSGVTIAVGATLDGTYEPSSGYITRANIVNGLILNGSANLGSADGLSAAESSSSRAARRRRASETLSGCGTVTLGGSTGNEMLADGNNGAGPVTLTIGSGITIQGGSGTLGSYYGNDLLVNDGTITGNWNGGGGTLTIGGNNGNGGPNNWTNNGIISGGGGTVDLAGSFNNGSLAEFDNSGGTVHLQGILTNATLALAPALGNWYLYGGTILGGPISATGGSTLTLTSSGGTFSGVTIAAGMTLNGTYEPSSGYVARANIIGGLTLDGSANLGSADGLSAAELFFQQSGTTAPAIETLSGSGTVTLGGSTGNEMLADGNNGAAPVTLTIGSGITVQGGSGALGGYYGNDSLVNDGAISANSAGGTLTVSENTLSNQGSLSSQNGGTLALPVALTVGGTSILSGSAASFMVFGGSLLDTTTNPAVQPAGHGDLQRQRHAVVAATAGGHQPGSGAVSAGFVNNSAYGTLALANNTYLELVNQTQNSSGTGSEAVYTNLLVVPSGTTLNLDGLNLYAGQVQGGGAVVNGTVTQVPSGGAAATNVIVGGTNASSRPAAPLATPSAPLPGSPGLSPATTSTAAPAAGSIATVAISTSQPAASPQSTVAAAGVASKPAIAPSIKLASPPAPLPKTVSVFALSAAAVDQALARMAPKAPNAGNPTSGLARVELAPAPS